MPCAPLLPPCAVCVCGPAAAMCCVVRQAGHQHRPAGGEVPRGCRGEAQGEGDGAHPAGGSAGGTVRRRGCWWHTLDAAVSVFCVCLALWSAVQLGKKPGKHRIHSTAGHKARQTQNSHTAVLHLHACALWQPRLVASRGAPCSGRHLRLECRSWVLLLFAPRATASPLIVTACQSRTTKAHHKYIHLHCVCASVCWLFAQGEAPA